MSKKKKEAALLSVLAAVVLTSFKLVVGIITGSLGILSEALHSALDLVAAVVTYFSVRVSDKPADRDHNYGHGKVENLSALIETLLLLITCVWVVYEALHRLISGNTHIEVSVWSFVIVIGSIVIDVNRSRMLYKVAKETNSQALEADALHFRTDIWSSMVVLLGLVFAKFDVFWADSVAAIAVALIILSVSYKLGKKAVDVLLDKAPETSLDVARQIIKDHPQVLDYHGLKARTAGADTFIKVNIHLDPELKLIDVHTLCDAIEKEIQERIPRSEIYIHTEPHEPSHTTSESGDDLK